MSRYRHLLFVCRNQRAAASPKGCCSSKGAADLIDRLKGLMMQHNLRGQIRIVDSGCHDRCGAGISVFVYSPGSQQVETWYGGLRSSDADELFEQHVLGGRRLQRCVVED